MTASESAPLAGITVVAMEQAVAAPMCTRVLADFGARVIKVENPNGGDFARDYDDVVNGPGGLAAHFVWCNRGKESVTLNLKSPAGMDILHRLLDRADALVSNLAPGSTGRLGLSPADLAAPPPERDPRRDRRLRPRRPDLAQARLRPADPGRRRIVCRHRLSRACPPSPGRAVADFTTGLYAALSILALLFSRATGREGPAPAVGLSLFDVMTDVMGYQLTYTQHSGIDQQPLGVGSPAVAPYGAFRDPRRADRGARHHQRPRMAAGGHGRSSTAPTWPTTRGSPPTPAGARTATMLDEAIGSWCAQHDLAHIQKTADAAGIGNSRYNLPSEVVVHPQLTARDRWREVETSNGPDPGAAAAAGDRRITIRRWARFPGLASTPTPCSPNSAWAPTRLPCCAIDGVIGPAYG